MTYLPFITWALTLGLFQHLTSAIPFIGSASAIPKPPLSFDTLVKFPLGAKITRAENIAIRLNGLILTTFSTGPTVYQVDPFRDTGNFLPVATFPGVNSTLGIAELSHDIFYVAAGILDLASFNVGPASFAVWEVDVRGLTTKDISKAKVKVAARFPKAKALNGLLALNSKTLLIADCELAVVWSLDVPTGAVAIVASDPLMAPPLTATNPIGINGIKVFGSDLFFTNYANGTLNRIPINLKTGKSTGPASIIVDGVPGSDDFVFDAYGDAFIAGNSPANELYLVKNAAGGGKNVENLGTFKGTTAGAFGRTKGLEKTLFLTGDGIFAEGSGFKLTGGSVAKTYVGVKREPVQ